MAKTDQQIAAYLNGIEDRIAKPFRNEVMREKNRFITQQASRFDVTARVSDVDFAEHVGNMRAIFEKYYSVTIRTFSAEKFKHMEAMEPKSSFWETIFGGWVRFRAGNAAKETATTTKNDIRKVILAAQESPAGQGRASMVRALLLVRGLSAWRAATIARTETGAAASYASSETAKKVAAQSQSEWVKKWIPVHDSRTRHPHAAMDYHEAIPLDAKFNVNGERLDRPLDPAGSAGNVINCRCVAVERVKNSRFAN